VKAFPKGKRGLMYIAMEAITVATGWQNRIAK
jgi:hypothetical protein